MNLASHYITDAAIIASLPEHGTAGIAPAEAKHQAGRLAGLKQLLRGLWFVPEAETVTPILRGYPR